MDRINLSLKDARALAVRVLKANGCDQANAEAVAGIMMAAEGDICESHGLFRLPGYVTSLRNGKVDGRAKPVASVIAPSILRVDGKGGFAPLAIATGMPGLIDLARTQGMAALALRNIYHFAALWPEIEMLTDASLVGMAFTAASPMVAPAGGTKPFFGTNPMAFGFPRDGAPPLVFDQASAAMARGDVMIHARDGKELPPGCGIDANGKPTTDPNRVLEGAQLPFGGYKGSGIAMMIELLTGGLMGDLFSYEAGRQDNADGGPPPGGELILAFDPARFGEANGWRTHAEDFFRELASQDGVRLPGQRRHRNRQKTPTEGIQVNRSLYDKIVELAG
ncbi:MAG: Ldh family oxidoreductase [Rhodospirillales bacterium]